MAITDRSFVLFMPAEYPEIHRHSEINQINKYWVLERRELGQYQDVPLLLKNEVTLKISFLTLEERKSGQWHDKVLKLT